jgi:hypothetical protein
MRHHSDGTFDRNSPWMIPTQEDVLEVNAPSIVSDCRAIIAGTLVPRPYSHFSSMWHPQVKEPQRHRTETHRKNCSVARRSYLKSRVRPLNKKQVKGFRKMVNLLVANGSNIWDARMKARELLGLDGPIEVSL